MTAAEPVHGSLYLSLAAGGGRYPSDGSKSCAAVAGSAWIVDHSTAEPLDVIHAQRLAACANVELRACSEGAHELVVRMEESGELDLLLGGIRDRGPVRVAAP